MNLTLAKQTNFGTVKCNIYQNDNKEIYMTREQIGQALEYVEPRIAISNIHSRNKERLDRYSSVIRLSTEAGERETTVYTAKGVYEICRFSNQPKANEFMDWVWDVVESIRTTGTYQGKPMTQAEILAAQAQMLVAFEKEINQTKQLATDTNTRLDSALDVFAAPTEPEWRQDMNRRIKGMCMEHGLNYLKTFGALYKELEQVARVDLASRVGRLKGRMAKGGATRRERESVTKMDVIERDIKLQPIFEGIVRRYQAKYSTKYGA